MVLTWIFSRIHFKVRSKVSNYMSLTVLEKILIVPISIRKQQRKTWILLKSFTTSTKQPKAKRKWTNQENQLFPKSLEKINKKYRFLKSNKMLKMNSKTLTSTSKTILSKKLKLYKPFKTNTLHVCTPKAAKETSQLSSHINQSPWNHKEDPSHHHTTHLMNQVRTRRTWKLTDNEAKQALYKYIPIP
jgi:hypothetical protein